MNKADTVFRQNLLNIRNNGVLDVNPRPRYIDGTPAHTKYITQVFEEYDLSDPAQFPCQTYRNTAVKTGIREIFWIYQRGSNSLKEAREMGVNWWDSWNIGDDTIGTCYGYTVKTHNLMSKLLDGLKNNPFGRRHIINLFQDADLQQEHALDPCCYETIWSVRNANGVMYLDMTLMQRSSDYLVANFVNKTQYIALQMMVASHCGYKPGKFCHFVQNVHIYDRHEPALNEILQRNPLSEQGVQPHFYIRESAMGKNFYDYSLEDFVFVDFNKIPKIESELELAI